jgi:hypothetical protein
MRRASAIASAHFARGRFEGKCRAQKSNEARSPTTVYATLTGPTLPPVVASTTSPFHP